MMERKWKIFIILLFVIPVLIAAVGKATNFLGTNDADNMASTSSVVANRDGSLLERSEFIFDTLLSGTTIGSGINLDHLMKTAVSSIADLTTEVPDNTALALILTNDGNTSDYSATTMSLEKIAQDVAAILVDTSTTLDDFLDTEIAAIVADTAYIADSELPAAPTSGSLAAQVEKSAYNETVLLHAGSVANLFTVTGGPILLTAVIAECYSTVSANACALTLTVDPTVGVDTAMQTSVIDINGMTAGSVISWSATGNAADGAIRVPGTSLPYGSEQGIVIPEGTIDLTLANSDPTSGAAHFYIRYKPLRKDALVTGD